MAAHPKIHLKSHNLGPHVIDCDREIAQTSIPANKLQNPYLTAKKKDSEHQGRLDIKFSIKDGHL